MNEAQLDQYLKEIWHDPEGSQSRHLALREAHTVALTDQAPGTFEWAAPRIAAQLKNGERMLDIGCGNDQYLTYLLARPGLLELGVGLDKNLDAGRLILETKSRSIQNLIKGNALHLPFANESFTAAMANRMLNQTRDIARALAEAARVLRPNGQIFVVTADSEKRSSLRELHEGIQENLKFSPQLYRHSTRPDQRLNLENGPQWLSPYFDGIKLERYERVIVFRELPELMEYYASGLLFHKASLEESPDNLPLWPQLYHTMEEELAKILSSEGQVEIHEGAALFIGKRREERGESR